MIKKPACSEKVIKKMVSQMVATGPGDWPPVCVVFTYQPQRPQKRRYPQEPPVSEKSTLFPFRGVDKVKY